MAVDSSIDFRIVKSSSNEVASPIETISTLVTYGWSLIDEDGRVSYLPVRDDGMFDWNANEMRWACNRS